ncbi:MAG: hypothetical protein EOP32_11955 [Rhodococcus sp. (in: high G+C Gram-positive bacteria)]|nr:MAG: hypothetical protein EOP32_11955 [Rhodococcus sp. (in: high G+C Gram-positive bacteria)]
MAKRERFAERWPTKNSLEWAAQAASGAEIGTNSDELFSALHPTDEAAAMEFLNGPERRYILTEDNELIEIEGES